MANNMHIVGKLPNPPKGGVYFTLRFTSRNPGEDPDEHIFHSATQLSVVGGTAFFAAGGQGYAICLDRADMEILFN